MDIFHITFLKYLNSIKVEDKDLDDLNDLKNSKKVLYICDNAGEIVFDKLLIEEIKKYVADVVVAVKGKPILNDATLEDAEFVGINEIARVISTGGDIIGVILEECSQEFLDEFYSADMIVAKGMGNYESLTEYEEKIEKLTALFSEIPNLYVADGHHRSASGTKVGQKRRAENSNHTGEEEYNYFLSVIFPHNQLDRKSVV